MSEPTSDYADSNGHDGNVPLPQIICDEARNAFRRQRATQSSDAVCRWRITLRGDTAAAANHMTISSKQHAVGLIGAVDRFDADNGAAFVSFAVPTMMGEVRRHFRDYGWAVHVPRRVKDVQPQLTKSPAKRPLPKTPPRTERLRNRRASRHRAAMGSRRDDRR